MSVVSCSMCHVEKPSLPGIPLAELSCKCGAVGNWQIVRSTRESFEAGVREHVRGALASGVPVADVRDTLKEIAEGVLS